ncbi:MAG: hypothetical protein ABJC05_02535 [Pyrinomonadaceae bacterium]
MTRLQIIFIRHAAVLVLFTLITAMCWETASAQDAWTRKHFTQWDRKDVERVMNDSPWVASQEVRINYARQVQMVAGAPSTNTDIGGPALVRTEQNTAAVGGARAPLDFLFRLRLRSGLPIRAALLREKQLNADYDHLGEKERLAFDAKWEGILQCPACAENYVVTLSSSSKEQPGADAVYSVFKGGRLADLQRYVYIASENGERRALVHFVPPKAPGEEAIFYFARNDEKGAPLFNPKSRELIFNLTNNEISLIANFRVNVSRLLIDGEVSF